MSARYAHRAGTFAVHPVPVARPVIKSPAVQCAWCPDFVPGQKLPDDPDLRVSHGICPECRSRQNEEFALYRRNR